MLANCNVFEIDTAGNVFPRFSPSRVGTELDTYQKLVKFILRCCCFIPRKVIFALLTPDSEAVRCNISTLEREKSPKFEDFMFCRTTFTI